MRETLNKVIALGRHVAVKPNGNDEKTKSGIVIKNTSTKVLSYGMVLSVGQAETVREMKLEEGHKIIFQHFEREDFILEDGTKVNLVRDDQILGRYE